MKPSMQMVVESIESEGHLQRRLIVDIDGSHRGSFILDDTPSDVYQGLILAGYANVTYRHNWKKEERLSLQAMRDHVASAEGYIGPAVQGQYGDIVLLDKYFVGLDDYHIDVFVNGRGQWGTASVRMNLKTLEEVLNLCGFSVTVEERKAVPEVQALPLAA
jgi:hypothetical protein